MIHPVLSILGCAFLAAFALNLALGRQGGPGDIVALTWFTALIAALAYVAGVGQ